MLVKHASLLIIVYFMSLSFMNGQIHSIDFNFGFQNTGASQNSSEVISYEPTLNNTLTVTTNFLIIGNTMFSIGIKAGKYSYSPFVNDESRWPSQHDGNGGFDPNISGPVIELSPIEFSFVSLPTKLSYALLNKAISLRPYLGIDFYHSYKVADPYKFIRVSNLSSFVEPVSSNFITGTIGLEVSTALGRKIMLCSSVYYQSEVTAKQKGIGYLRGERKIITGIDISLRFIIN